MPSPSSPFGPLRFSCTDIYGGVTELFNGEEVGYHVMHSLTFPGARAMNGDIRAHCAFYKQQSAGSLHENSEPGVCEIAVEFGPTAQISAQHLECANTKKLAWRVTTSSSSSSSGSRNSGVCFNCGAIASILSRSDSCALCSRPICPACNVKKALMSVISWTGGFAKHKMRFCESCVSEANEAGRSCFSLRGVRSRRSFKPQKPFELPPRGANSVGPVLRPSALSS